MRTSNPARKQYGLKRLCEQVRALQGQGEKVVFTNGCFDLLHVGHVRYLAAARAFGDCLVVGVNSDASVRGIKGNTRPIVAQKERVEVLSALEAVDYLVLFNEQTPEKVIVALRPDILVKGADWPIEKIVGRDLVEGHGGRVMRVKTVPGASTTGLIERIVKRYHK